jgi:hypothetical protein
MKSFCHDRMALSRSPARWGPEIASQFDLVVFACQPEAGAIVKLR